MFLKGDKFDIDKKYYNNIKAYIIGKIKIFLKMNLETKLKIKISLI